MFGRAAAALALVMLVSGCGSEPAPPSMSAADLFMEYARSTEVENDRFPNFGGSEDRLANFAAHGAPEQIQALLFQTFDCELAGGDFPTSDCRLGAPVKKAAESFGGKPHGRSLVVRHADGSLELVTVYVLVDGERTTLADQDGNTYTDLEDFRANNDLLSADDLVLTLRDITSVPGEGEFVVVTGRVPSAWESNWRWWVFGGLGGLVVLAAAGALTRRARHRRALPGPGEQGRTGE